MIGRKECLDKGYVILHDTLGTDLTVANAARVSYDKRAEKMRAQDERLINFLAEEGHTSPFRHATLQFEVYAPLMVARQWWKYVVGSDHVMDAWNESSRRYVTEEPTFYVPDAEEWRGSPENKKQGSAGFVPMEIGYEAWVRLMRTIETAEENYKWALDNGICAEQARLYLPAYGMYVRYYWTTSLQATAHFINQRLGHDAQVEIQEYAKAVNELALKAFPVALGALTNG